MPSCCKVAWLRLPRSQRPAKSFLVCLFAPRWNYRLNMAQLPAALQAAFSTNDRLPEVEISYELCLDEADGQILATLSSSAQSLTSCRLVLKIVQCCSRNAGPAWILPISTLPFCVLRSIWPRALAPPCFSVRRPIYWMYSRACLTLSSPNSLPASLSCPEVALTSLLANWFSFCSRSAKGLVSHLV